MEIFSARLRYDTALKTGFGTPTVSRLPSNTSGAVSKSHQQASAAMDAKKPNNWVCGVTPKH